MRLSMYAAAGMAFLGLALVVGAADNATTMKLVGKWKIVKSEDAPPGATAEFTKDGKLKLHASINGKELNIEGTYKVEGKKITSTLTFGGKTKSDTATIKKLTEKELVIQDDKGKDDEYERVK